MNFAAITSGTSWFIDANVFVYDFAADPQYGPACRTLLERVESGELHGYVSSSVLHDVAHRLMTLEACTAFGWPYAGIAQRLRRNFDQIKMLQKFAQAVKAIQDIGVHVLSVDAAEVTTATEIARTHGLLCGDALIVSVMQANGLTMVASNDADFDRVSGITRASPI
jgi:predicted nucleic acid-binding protein